jgi:hypothetical protein
MLENRDWMSGLALFDTVCVEEGGLSWELLLCIALQNNKNLRPPS